jgi:transcriptional regulator with XRE-family HTH domain
MTTRPRTDAARRLPPRPKRRVSAELRGRLGENLRALRHARGLTQAELAARVPCHHRWISDLENSRYNATLATLEMLARALDCCESDLLRRPLRGGSTAAQPLRGGTTAVPLNPRRAEAQRASAQPAETDTDLHTGT